MSPAAKVFRPITVALPPQGVFFAESAHAARFEMPWRQDPFHKILYVLHGATQREQRRPKAEVVLRQGALTIIPAEAEHRLRDVQPSTLLLLCVAPEFLQRNADVATLWQQILASPARPYLLDRWARQRLEPLWRQAIFEQKTAATGAAVALQVIATQVLLQLSRLPAQRSRRDAQTRIEHVTRELEDSFFENWNLDRAAARAEMSRRSFSAHFSKQAGCTFLAYLTDKRLKHAAQLLRDGSHSILGAAFSAGYGDVTHFYRLFRNHFGMTPKQWMEQRGPNRADDNR